MPGVAANPGKSGIHAMPLATDAFAARMVLAATAQRSIDAQYYIWHADQTGLLLFEALADAARRGVRVRILIDDQNTAGIEGVLAALGADPNVQVRLYNPFAHRGVRSLGYLGDFQRLNRRMHNKAFISDNQVAVVGGRNIGNEYFGAGTEVPFKDLDVVAIGAAVRDVSDQFDLYWNSPSAYPASWLLGAGTPEAAGELRSRFAANRDDAASRTYLESVRRTPLLDAILERRLAFEWTQARLVRDDPAKTLDRSERTDLLLLSQLLGQGGARVSLDMISPYFVPGDKGADFLEQLARSGIRVRVLTNSFVATDVSVVHAGYAKRRCRLARAGVQLYELKGTGDAQPRESGGSGSKSASLHAKTYAVDRERIFIGSFNFDPRSALLNTEMGLVIASRDLAGRVGALFDEGLAQRAYEVRVRPDGDCVEWIERTESGEIRHATEPGAGWARRAWLGFLALLPIDWML
jgi:putative cardiolipin synthase